MHQLDIYGFPEQELCVGCAGHCGADAGGDACAPASKRRTDDLLAELKTLLAASGLDVAVDFYRAEAPQLSRHADVERLLSLADLAPAIVLDGKLLFFGGFEPAGLLDEIRKRI
jgi:hypothetical protein